MTEDGVPYVFFNLKDSEMYFFFLVKSQTGGEKSPLGIFAGP